MVFGTQSATKDYLRANFDKSKLLVNRCFKPSQPLGIKSGLKETFLKRYIVERTNKAEIRSGKTNKQKNKVRTRRVVGRIYGIKLS